MSYRRCFSLLFIMIVSLSAAVLQCAAQETEISLTEQYPSLLYREHFDLDVPEKYYRAPAMELLYDPFDLAYFPHESWPEPLWVLLGRKTAHGIYEQMLMQNDPGTEPVIQGTAVGAEHGFLDDFYLYATLFAADNYPESSGTCYLYYSDSLFEGLLHTSHGLLIAPGMGIYRTVDSYAKKYDPATSTHEMELLLEFSPEDFAFPTDDISSSVLAANEFDANTEKQFLSDWKTLRNAYRMPGSPDVKPYRLEIIRRNALTDVYINGTLAAQVPDHITKPDENENEIPEKVSWSYGPLLLPGGLTVNCSVGDIYIYRPGK